MIQKLTARITKFFNTKYWLFLVLVVLISYGQMLWMQPWEDDSGLFIKLANIQSNVGYFGFGPFGSGIYKYTAVPFIPIYHFFGHNIVAYFALCLVAYLVSTLMVYKLFSQILGKTAGRVAGFTLAAGYISSDAFWRMTNGVATCVSFVLVTSFIYFYIRYVNLSKFRYYLLALLFYAISLQYFVVRDLYLFAVAVIFELVFFVFKRPFKLPIYSFLRLIPFGTIFYWLVIMAGDSRSDGLKEFVSGIFHGHLELTYGFVSTLSNIVIPDYITNFIFKFRHGYAFLFVSILIIVFLFLNKFKNGLFLMRVYYILILFWVLVSKNIYKPELLGTNINGLHTATLGGAILITSILIIVCIKNRKLLILFWSWVLVNVAVYAAYFPTTTYETISRYMSHSFCAWTAVVGILYSEINRRKKLGQIFSSLVLIYIGLNLTNSVIYQHNFLVTKSLPVKKFYQDLQSLLPRIEKGDILYFDVSSDAQVAFRAAISGAMIPNTGTISWRYGVDRYDFKMFEDPSSLFTYLKDHPLDDKKIHTFFYSKNGLTETTSEFVKLFQSNKSLNINFDNFTSKYNLKSGLSGSFVNKSNLELGNLEIPSMIPFKLLVSLVAEPLDFSNTKYPVFYGHDKFDPVFINDQALQDLTFKYNKFKNLFKYSQIEVTSSWQDRVEKNLIDGDTGTVWQADRILWLDSEQHLIIKMNNVQRFSRLQFTNAYATSTPLDFEMFYSNDLVSWKSLGVYKNTIRMENGETKIIDFEPQNFRYFKIKFVKTLNGDSPAISEVMLIPSEFDGLNIFQANQYLANPFANMPNADVYNKLLFNTQFSGRLNIAWNNDKFALPQSDPLVYSNINFDGKMHTYEFSLPAGGRVVNKLMFEITNFPGQITINNIKVIY